MRVVSAWILGLVLVAGCGGGSSSSSGGAGCQAACKVCSSELCADCAATSARFRDDFENAVYACVKQGADAAACDSLWATCVVQAEGSITPRAIDDSYRTACLAKKSECDATSTTFADDDCLLSRIVEERLVMQAQQCLSQSCAQISACFNPIFG